MLRRIQNGARRRDIVSLKRMVNVLDNDHAFIHQDSDCQREATECHDVDRLSGEPERYHGSQERERNGGHHN